MIALVGCNSTTQETGSFTAVFKSMEDAEESYSRGTIELNIPNGRVTLQPRRVPTLFDQEKSRVEYIVSIDLKSNWKIKDDDHFRSLVSPAIRPAPEDIIAIRLHRVRYSNRPVERSSDITKFHDQLRDRGIGGWSFKEIKLLLPEEETLPSFPIDSQRHKVWFEWPADERQLFLEFEYDEDKGEQILRGFGLDHP